MAKLKKQIKLRPKKVAAENIVQPIVRELGKPHVLEAIFDGDQSKMPTLTSVGYAKLDGTNQWVSYVLTTKGNDVLLIEVGEPDVEAIAEETSKINFANHLMTQGEL